MHDFKIVVIGIGEHSDYLILSEMGWERPASVPYDEISGIEFVMLHDTSVIWQWYGSIIHIYGHSAQTNNIFHGDSECKEICF